MTEPKSDNNQGVLTATTSGSSAKSEPASAETTRGYVGPPVPRTPPMESSTSLSPATVVPPKPLSPWVKPLVWLYRLCVRDKQQAQSWLKRIESIEHAQDIDAEASTEGKAILSDKAAWRQIKATGLGASSGTMTMGAMWIAWLVHLYATGHGFGWLAASAYLLPVPLAWRVGRKLWESAALQGMKELGSRPTPNQQLRTLSSGMVRGMMAGAATGFTLVFTQALISWFMTPAPTLLIELIIDLIHGTMGAVVGATIGAVFGPLVGRPAPISTQSLKAPPRSLPGEDSLSDAPHTRALPSSVESK
ncbi:MAG: hypothetical protein KTR25_08705 [Myxococcales bacterium]|nr:hypothetical protein [Myxococcales bacterium]